MKKKKIGLNTIALNIIIIILIIISTVLCLTSCSYDENKYTTKNDIQNTQNVVNNLVNHQQTPTDIDYSLERYNLIKRAYWVNGQREKAMTLPCGVQRPLGYIVLFSSNGAVIGRFVVDGKVSSLNSFLTPNMKQEGIGSGGVKETELPDIDGSYGENVDGIFFFTVEGSYLEWKGDYLYSDIPFIVDDPILKVE